MGEDKLRTFLRMLARTELGGGDIYATDDVTLTEALTKSAVILGGTVQPFTNCRITLIGRKLLKTLKKG